MKTILTSIFRNFSRKPATNLINLFGLSVSLALVIILSAYCYSELTTDSFHKNSNTIYLFSDKNNLPGINTPGVLTDHIKQSIPGVESTLRLAGTWETPVFKVEGRDPITSDLVFADDNFFQFFTYEAITGDLATALKDPMAIVITQPLAKKLFGENDAIGKTIKLNNDKELTVKAVINESKSNSMLSFNAITSMSTRKIVMPNDAEFSVWPFCIFQTFLMLKENINPETTAQQISALFPGEMKQKPSMAQLTPLKRIYFTQFSLFNNNYLHQGDRKKVMILLLVAALVLLIALVNFQNISSAKWFEKTKQIGTMKVNGASKGHLIRNIITEAFLFFLISLVVAFAMVGFFAPSICTFTGIKLNPQLLFSPSYLVLSVASIFVLSLLLCVVPALKISSTKAIDNLRKNKNHQSSSSVFSGIMITSQFSIAIVLIAFTILVQKQVEYGSSNLGMNQQNVIGIKLTPELFGKKDVLKNALSAMTTTKNITFSQYFPGDMISHGESQVDEAGEKKPVRYDSFFADAGFFNTMGLQLIAGRYYSDDLSTDIRKVVVNESFIIQNNITNPLGLRFKGMDQNEYEITGVVKDFHYKSFNTSIAPLAIMNIPWATHCLVELQTANSNSLYQSVKEIKTIAAGLSLSFPVEVSFLDQAVENMYQSEVTFRRAFSLFSGCAIIICCLGILAMSLFACQRRIKEIGVRKVNGASISEVLVMLNRDFVKWVAIAFVIATPIAWHAMHKWLENFAYKTELSWWIFALAGCMAMVIALITVSFQSWKAATRNPVEALRYE